MERAPSPTSTPISAGPQVATHSAPVLEADPGPEPWGELRELAAALRSHLGWLHSGGVLGVPRPPQSPERPRRASPTAARAPESAAPSPDLQADRLAGAALPPLPPGATDDSAADDAASAARAALQASARAASGSLRPAAPTAGRAAAYPPAAPAALLKAPPAEARYPELDDPALSQGSAEAGLAQVRQILGDCRRCKLCHGRNNIVFGEGNPEPWVVFVGEGPGADEDRLGQPFVGAAGELLNRMIKAMGDEAGKRGQAELREHLSRQQVYIANIVKCRPPGNRTPEADEIAACAPFLRAQLARLQPRVIVALGRTPTHYLLQTTAPISRLRGQFATWNGIPVMPTYHPAYVLRTEGANKLVWDDLKQVIERLSH